VDAADPSGTQAMAATASDNGQGGLLSVDSVRLGAVTAWDPAWVGTTSSEIGGLLHPPTPAQSIPVNGKLSITTDFFRESGDSPLTLRLGVRAASGIPVEVSMGTLLPGRATYSVDLPACVGAPCTLTAFTFAHPIALPSTDVTGTLTITDVRDARGPVDITAQGKDTWRPGSTSLAFPVEGGATITAAADGTLELKLDVLSPDDGAIEVADHPVSLPTIEGSDHAADPNRDEAFPVVAGMDGRFTSALQEGSGVLPRLLRQGTMVDLPYVIAAMGTQPNPLDYQIWLSSTATPAVRDALVKQGLDVISVESISETEAKLDRGGGALALRLFLLAALVALVLGAGTLLANAYVVIRRRAYELAALRAIGAPRSVLIKSARREQVTLALTGLALGAASGLVAAGFALPSLLDAAGGDGPPLWYGPAWAPVAVLVVSVLVLLVVVADVGARRTVRRALPELLRQVQE
jgi:putative ABC transport system permease protein